MAPLQPSDGRRRSSVLSWISSKVINGLGGGSDIRGEAGELHIGGDFESYGPEGRAGAGSSSSDGVISLECAFRSGSAWVEVHRAPIKTVARMREKVRTNIVKYRENRGRSGDLC